MQEREAIIAELWSRLASVTGVKFTARNPRVEPSVDDLPCIQFWELDDVVEEASQRGDYPAYKRMLKVTVESFIKSGTDASSSKELSDFIVEVKKKIYEGGNSLGSRCALKETGNSRMLRPPVGENVIGMGLNLEIRYVETTANLFK